MEFTIIFTILVTLINGYRFQILKTKQKSSDWTLGLIQKEINQTIVDVTKSECQSVIQCTLWCIDQLAERGLSMYFNPSVNRCYCNLDVDTRPDDIGSLWIYYGQFNNIVQIEEESESLHQYTSVWPQRSECKDLLNDGFETDGVYSIMSWDGFKVFVFCDMSDGGWTVIQRRFDGSVDFYRNWNDYRYGFGNKTGEYWLGLEDMHRLTKNKSELSIYLEAFPGVNPPVVWARYTDFLVGDHSSNFRLQISGFTGNCGDSFWVGNGLGFTTYDNDNDLYYINCAVYLKGAGWLKACFEANMNGLYFKEGEYSPVTSWGYGIHWRTCYHIQTSLKSTLLKIRKKST